MAKILLVEDDENLSIKLKDALLKWKFEIVLIRDFSNCFEEFREISPDLIIMDIGLPVFDGYYWCQRIREVSKVPIVFLSSRDQNIDIVMAMNMGGDDYITKPFSTEVLIAKIQALLRRTYDYGEVQRDCMEFQGLVLDHSRSRLIFETQEIELTRNELKIISELIKNGHKIVSRHQMMNALWDDDQFVNDNTLTVNMNRLRHKLQERTGQEIIETKKGQGYRISIGL